MRRQFLQLLEKLAAFDDRSLYDFGKTFAQRAPGQRL